MDIKEVTESLGEEIYLTDDLPSLRKAELRVLVFNSKVSHPFGRTLHELANLVEELSVQLLAFAYRIYFSPNQADLEVNLIEQVKPLSQLFVRKVTAEHFM